MNPLLPDVLAVRRECNESNELDERGANARIVIELHVPPALAHFPGHFPGLPILPGVVQIDWAVRLARLHLPGCCAGRRFSALEGVKFQALVLPDARLELALFWNAAKDRLEFSYSNGQRKCSTGRLVFGAAA